MTQLGHGDIEPGTRLAAAPLRLVTRLDEATKKSIAEETLNSRDQGVVWTLMSRYETGCEDFDSGIYRMEAGEYHPKHIHPAGAELYYFLEGRCLVTVNDDEVEAAPGTAIYLPAGTIHAVRTPPDQHMVMLYCFNRGDFRETGMYWKE